MLFFGRKSSFLQHITSKSNTVQQGGFDPSLSTSKTLTFKNGSTSLPSCKKVKTFSTCQEATYKRLKRLVVSRRVQDAFATRTKANIFPKTSTKEQRLERTDKLGSERAEADSGLVKLVVMTNVFFNNQQHEIKTHRFICVKQIKSSFFSNNGNQHFYS